MAARPAGEKGCCFHTRSSLSRLSIAKNAGDFPFLLSALYHNVQQKGDSLREQPFFSREPFVKLTKYTIMSGCLCADCLKQKTAHQNGLSRLSKKVCSPLGPLCEGAPPAGGGGENCAVARNILGYGKVLSLRPFGAPPSQREVFRHAAPSPDGEGFLFFIASPPARLRARRGAPRASKRRSASGCGQTAAGG